MTDERDMLPLRISLALATLGLACLAASIWWVSRRAPSRGPLLAANDPAVKQAALERLVANSQGFWDGFPDDAVGRVLLPDLDQRESYGGALVSSNRFGLRERDFAMPKRAGTIRIVLLGDSFVYGNGVQVEERVGFALEEALKTRAGADAPEIEVLHIGLAGWNILNECAFLRRQLGLLRPDLVVHVLFYNDLDDGFGTRGFGGMGYFAPEHTGRADGRISRSQPYMLGENSDSFLTAGLDGESRARYDGALQAITRLKGAVEDIDGRYVPLLYWPWHPEAADKRLIEPLGREQALYLPTRWWHDPALSVSKADSHWNGAGHEQVAQMLYGAILERELLPHLPLTPWPEAAAALASLDGEGRAEAARRPSDAALRDELHLRAAIDFRDFNAVTAAQVLGGVDKQQKVSPYAAVLLRNPGGELHLQGKRLGRPELTGTMHVFLDEYELGTVALATGAPIDQRWPVPAALADRPCVALRLESDDFVYTGRDLRRGVVCELREVSIGR